MILHPHSLSRLPGWSRLIGLWLLLSLALLVAAWLLPIMTVTKLFVWSTEVSILDSVVGLWQEGEYGLLAIIVLFSIIFPLLKLFLGLRIWARVDATSQNARKTLNRLQWLGKWSMVDVFVVALVVVAIKVSLVSDVTVHAGVYVFCAAIIFSIIAMHFLEKALIRVGESGGTPAAH